MGFGKRTLTEKRLERRRRLLLILPEVVKELDNRKNDLELRGRQITEINQGIKAVLSFQAKLKLHETMHDITIGSVVGSPVIGNMYFKLTGNKDLSSFLECDFSTTQDLFRTKGMDVPVVLEEIYKKYKRLEIPLDDRSPTLLGSRTPFDC